MWDLIKQWVVVFLLTGVGWAVTTLVLFAMGFGHLRTIRTLLRVRRLLAPLPAGTVFHWRSGDVVVTAYDPVADEEVSLFFARVPWPTLLKWKPGTGKSKDRMRGRIDAEIAWRTALLLLVTVPAFAVCAWLTATADPMWGYALVFLVAHQTLTALSGRIFFLKFWAVAMVTTYFCLDRVNLWHPSPQVAAPMFCGFVLLSILVVGLIDRSERKDEAARRDTADRRARTRANLPGAPH
ncbi:hypothetical protein [Streptomyces sp. NPDC090093]|uniref:hypothetical protein n=1 Tax=Streptomyces sp. NPDC090093 TaxID=3365945 RepID=UPI0037F152F3